MLQKAAQVAKNNPRDDGRLRFVDVVQDMDISEDVMKADMVTGAIGGIHTTGLSE